MKVFMYLDDDVFKSDGMRAPENYYKFLGRNDLLEKMNSFNTIVKVTCVENAMTYIETHGCPNFISFDNDLGKKLEGVDLAHWLVEKDLDKPGFIPKDFDFVVHSQNNIAAPRLVNYLESYLKVREPVEVTGRRNKL